MPDMHLKQPELTWSARGPFTKNKETGDSRYVYQSKLDKACLQRNMTYVILKI